MVEAKRNEASEASETEQRKALPGPYLLSKSDTNRVHRVVAKNLPPRFDREFIADTIILDAWLKSVPHISNKYIRDKCISAWRREERERRANEGAVRCGLTRTNTMIMSPNEGTPTTETPAAPSAAEDAVNQLSAERAMLVEQAVGKLNPFERKLIWMKFYDGQTLEQIAKRTTLRRDQVQRALKVAIYKMRVHLSS